MAAEAGSAREAPAAEIEAGLAREARPAVEEATSARGRSCRWMWAVFVARRLAGGGAPVQLCFYSKSTHPKPRVSPRVTDPGPTRSYFYGGALQASQAGEGR
uniref:Uncharacterized protein n=1 Tax=Oryza glumipatula TaxID=40148 RepID=A0A0D9YGH4_9ORYZ